MSDTTTSAAPDPTDFRPVSACPWCGSESASHIATRIDGVPVHRCARCHLGFAAALPDDLGVFYDEGYYRRHARVGEGPAITGYEDYEAAYGPSSFRWLAVLLRSLAPDEGARLLDVGAATGTFLEAARVEGFDVEGVELNEAAVGRAREKGLHVRSGFFDPTAFGDERFDIVTALEVVEHVRDPGQFLRDLAQVVAPGGVMCFLVPNVHDGLVEAYGDDALDFRKSLDHTLYFNPPSLEAMCTELFGEGSLTLHTGDVEQWGQTVSFALGFIRPDGASSDPERALVEALLPGAGADALVDLDGASALGIGLSRAKFFDFDGAQDALTVALAKGAPPDRHATAVAQLHRNKGEILAALRVLTPHLIGVSSDPFALQLALELVLEMSAIVGAPGADLATAMTALHGASTALDGRAVDAERQAAVTAERLAEVEERFAELEARLVAAYALSEERSAELETLRADRDRLSGDIADRNELLATLAAGMREVSEEVAASRGTLERLDADRARAVERSEHLLVEVTRLEHVEADLERARSTAAAAAARAAAASAAHATVEQQLDEIYGARAYRLVAAIWAVRRAITRTLSAPGRALRDRGTAVDAPDLQAPLATSEPEANSGAHPAAQRPERVVLDPRVPEVTVSVIVPVYDKGSVLLEAIASLDAQTFDDLEIVVWDDGSSDPATLAALDEIERNPRVRRYRGPNRGVIAARNAAFSVAKGRYVACLDPDDRFGPTYLEKAVTILEGDPDVDLVYPWMRTTGDRVETWQTQDLDPALIAEVNHVPMCAVMRYEVIARTGGFSPAMAEGYEDWEFWAHVAEAGFRGSVIPEPLFEYTFSESKTASRDATARERHLELATRISQRHPLLRGPDAATLTRPRTGRRSPDDALRQLPRSFPTGSGRPVVVSLPWLTVGGADTVALTLIEALRDAGRTVIALTTVDLGPGMADRFVELLDATPHAYRLSDLGPPSSWTAIATGILDALGPATWLNIGSPWFYDAIDELRREHPDLWVCDQQFNDIGHAEGNRRAAGSIDRTITAYRGLEAGFRADGRPAEALASILVGIEHPEPLEPAAVAAFREEAGVPDGLPVVAFVGRLSEEKRPGWVPEICDQLGDAVHVVVVGDGPLADELGPALAGRGNLSWVRHVEDVGPVLAAADVVMIPSVVEGIPLVLMESLAHGTPVVATAVGGIPELEGTSGLHLCDPDDVVGFAAAIEKALATNEHVSLPPELEVGNMCRSYLEVLNPDHD